MKRIHHLGVYDKNFGDTALNMQVDSFFINKSIYSYSNIYETTSKDFNYLNEKTRNGILLVGGGGLLHEYLESGEARPTGCIWEVPKHVLPKIKAKIILYSVGYNHFYTDKIPKNMRFFLEYIINSNGLIGLRNDGSKERLSKIFPDLTQYFYEVPDVGVFCRSNSTIKKDYILLQIACDRLNKRYGNDLDKFLKLIGDLVRPLNRKIKIIPHTVQDDTEYKKMHLNKYFKNYEILPLMNKTKDLNKVLDIYKESFFTISTRGHSQIISVGNNVPTFSIATHKKINGFAKSCNLENYIFDYINEPLNMCYEKFNTFLNDLDKIKSIVIDKNKDFDQEIDDFNRKILL